VRAQDAEGKNRVEVEEEGCQIKDNATHSQERIITLLQLALVSLSLSLSFSLSTRALSSDRRTAGAEPGAEDWYGEQTQRLHPEDGLFTTSEKDGLVWFSLVSEDCLFTARLLRKSCSLQKCPLGAEETRGNTRTGAYCAHAETAPCAGAGKYGGRRGAARRMHGAPRGRAPAHSTGGGTGCDSTCRSATVTCRSASEGGTAPKAAIATLPLGFLPRECLRLLQCPKCKWHHLAIQECRSDCRAVTKECRAVTNAHLSTVSHTIDHRSAHLFADRHASIGVCAQGLDWMRHTRKGASDTNGDVTRGNLAAWPPINSGACGRRRSGHHAVFRHLVVVPHHPRRRPRSRPLLLLPPPLRVVLSIHRLDVYGGVLHDGHGLGQATPLVRLLPVRCAGGG